MLPCGARVVADNPVRSGDFRADNLIHLGRRSGPMKACCDQDCDPIAADARPMKPIKYGRQRYGIGCGTRDVADHDDGGLFAAGKVGEWRRCQRMIESVFEFDLHVFDGLYQPALENCASIGVWDWQVDAAFAEPKS